MVIFSIEVKLRSLIPCKQTCTQDPESLPLVIRKIMCGMNLNLHAISLYRIRLFFASNIENQQKVRKLSLIVPSDVHT